LLLSLTASAQVFDFGVLGGIPAQAPLGQTSKTPFVIGPVVNVHILPGLSLETGLLYRRLGQANDNFAFIYPENSVTLGSETRRGSSLELPFLAKYRFLTERRSWRPFLAAGPTVRRSSLTADRASVVVGNDGSAAQGLPNFNTNVVQWNLDPTVGAGVDARAGRFHLEPQVRYSYWGAGKTAQVRKNQVEFLLGFRF
jgi:hypothetical protein